MIAVAGSGNNNLYHIVRFDRGKRLGISGIKCKTRSGFSAGSGRSLLLLHHALERMLMLAREVHHLRYLGLGDFIGKNAALADTMMMNVQHDLGCCLGVLLEELFQYMNDEFH